MRPDEYEAVCRLEDAHWWYRALRRLTLMLSPTSGPDHVALDAGCGTGGLLRALRRRCRAVGVDYCALALDLARGKAGAGLAQASVEALPFRDRTFDVATSMDVLYHLGVEDDAAAMGEMLRVLKPGGVLLINLPAFEFLRSPHDGAIATRHRYTRREVCAKLVSAGFVVERATYWNLFLFPLVAAVRLWHKSAEPRSDLRRPPALVNVCLNVLLWVEAMVIRWVSLPFGVSVFCVARRPEKG